MHSSYGKLQCPSSGKCEEGFGTQAAFQGREGAARRWTPCTLPPGGLAGLCQELKRIQTKGLSFPTAPCPCYFPSPCPSVSSSPPAKAFFSTSLFLSYEAGRETVTLCVLSPSPETAAERWGQGQRLLPAGLLPGRGESVSPGLVVHAGRCSLRCYRHMQKHICTPQLVGCWWDKEEQGFIA